MTDTDQKIRALAFLKACRTGVLATISPEGAPRARTIYYEPDDAFAVYFLTLDHTRKVADLRREPRAAFVISDDQAPDTLQIEGVVRDLTESASIDPAVRGLMETLQEKGAQFAPITHLDPGHHVRFYKLVPSWIRFGDFVAQGDDAVFSELPA